MKSAGEKKEMYCWWCELLSLSLMLLSRSDVWWKGDLYSQRGYLQLASGYRSKRVGGKRERKRERFLSLLFTLNLEMEDSFRMWNHFSPKALMAPNFMANKLNNDAFESRSIWEALLYETKSHSFPVKVQLKCSFLIVQSTCECTRFVVGMLFCSLFEVRCLVSGRRRTNASFTWWFIWYFGKLYMGICSIEMLTQRPLQDRRTS